MVKWNIRDGNILTKQHILSARKPPICSFFDLCWSRYKFPVLHICSVVEPYKRYKVKLIWNIERTSKGRSKSKSSGRKETAVRGGDVWPSFWLNWLSGVCRRQDMWSAAIRATRSSYRTVYLGSHTIFLTLMLFHSTYLLADYGGNPNGSKWPNTVDETVP